MSEDIPRSFADDSNEFAFALYGQLRQRPGNLFFSPFSIRTALCMAEAGARGETAAQMKKALSISSADEALQVAFAETIQRLNDSRRPANSSWPWPTHSGDRMGLRSCRNTST